VWFGIAAIESATKKLALEKAPGFQAPLIAETGCDAHMLTFYWVYELPGEFISRELKIGGSIQLLTGGTLLERFV